MAAARPRRSAFPRRSRASATGGPEWPAPSDARRPPAGAVRAATPRAACASRRRVGRTFLAAPGSCAPQRAPRPTFTVVRSRAARLTATSVPPATRARPRPVPTRTDARPSRASAAAFSARPTPIARQPRRPRTTASDAPAPRTRAATAAPASTGSARIGSTSAHRPRPRERGARDVSSAGPWDRGARAGGGETPRLPARRDQVSAFTSHEARGT
jgi:hypothetical protein